MDVEGAGHLQKIKDCIQRILTIFVQETGARQKSHKLWIKRFPMEMTRGKKVLKLFHGGSLVQAMGIR